MELLNLQAPLWLTLILAFIGYIMGAVIEHYNMKGREKQSDETRRNNRILKTHYTGTIRFSNKSYTGTEKK